MNVDSPNTESSDQNTEEERAILDMIGKWLDKDVKPYVREFDHGDVYPKDMVDQMKEFGLFGATIAPEYGGLGLSATTYARIVSRIAETWMTLTGFFNSHLMMAMIVEKFGTEEQRLEWLPKFCSGEIRGGLALTEANAGTDLQAIRTRAKKRGNQDYVINGSKTWITNGIGGQCVALLVKTDWEVEPAYKGMSMFIAPKKEGFHTGKKLDKLGYKGIDSAELIFEDYVLSEEHLIGGKEGEGFYMAVSGLEIGRINIAARSVGIARQALQESVVYSQQRETFGKPICQHQAIQLKLGEMATRVRAAELLTEDAARAFDRGERCDMEAGMAKYFASEAALENAMEAMRIHGGYGYSTEYPIERLYRDAPLMCIGEGTNEMQRIIIAKQLIERNKI